jgi:hypothetical protein
MLFLAIVLSVLLLYTDYDYPFGFFKLFIQAFKYTGNISPGTEIEPAT